MKNKPKRPDYFLRRPIPKTLYFKKEEIQAVEKNMKHWELSFAAFVRSMVLNPENTPDLRYK